MSKERLLQTARCDVYPLTAEFSHAYQRYLLDNRARFAPYGPMREESDYTHGAVVAQIEKFVRGWQAQTELALVFCAHGEETIAGYVHFDQIYYGVFQACYLGYSIDAAYEGRGFMHEVLTAALDYVHHELGLHRVMANYLPHNHRSAKLLAKLGFVREGYAKSYLKINGKWQDMVLTARVFD